MGSRVEEPHSECGSFAWMKRRHLLCKQVPTPRKKSCMVSAFSPEIIRNSRSMEIIDFLLGGMNATGYCKVKEAQLGCESPNSQLSDANIKGHKVETRRVTHITLHRQLPGTDTTCGCR